jgi:uncharacterized membrane protein YoaK (UPF0700 family)
MVSHPIALVQPMGNPDTTDVTETAPNPQPDTLISALLLATTGGLLDAFVYTQHGHVFANAATGNVILLGINMLSGNWHQAIRHLARVLAFVAGVAASRLLRLLPHLRAGLSVLLLEMLVLFVAGLLPPAFPELAFTALIAFVSAFQVSTFRQVGRFSYNSTFITGNLRTAVDGLYNALDPATRKAGLRKFFELSCIVLAFITGATAGAILSPHLYNHTLWLINLPLLAVLLLTLRRARQASQSLATKEGEPALHPGPP